MTRIYFHKGINSKKPKRWYICDSEEKRWAEHSRIIVQHSYNGTYTKIRTKLLGEGFPLSKHHVHEDTLFPVYLYLYFRSYADEARFILWASDGVEI